MPEGNHGNVPMNFAVAVTSTLPIGHPSANIFPGRGWWGVWMGVRCCMRWGGVNLPCGWYRVRGQLHSTGGQDHTHTHTHTHKPRSQIWILKLQYSINVWYASTGARWCILADQVLSLFMLHWSGKDDLWCRSCNFVEHQHSQVLLGHTILQMRSYQDQCHRQSWTIGWFQFNLSQQPQQYEWLQDLVLL